MKRTNLIVAVIALLATAVVFSVLFTKGVKTPEADIDQVLVGSDPDNPGARDKQAVMAALESLAPDIDFAPVRDKFNQLTTADITAEYALKTATVPAVSLYFKAVYAIGSKDSATLHSAYFDLLTKESVNTNQAVLVTLLKDINRRSVESGFQENWSRINQSGIYRVTNQPMQAVAELQKVLENDSNNVEAIYWLGEMSIQSGQLEKARERFKKLVSLQPQNQDFRRRLVAICEELGDTECVATYSEE